MQPHIFYVKQTLVVLSFTVLSGCAKNSFFNTLPTAQLSQATYWKTSSDALEAVNGVYSSLAYAPNSGEGSGMYCDLVYFDAMTPNLYSNYPWEGYQDFEMGIQSPTDPDTNPVYYRWAGCYNGIGRANNLLANIYKPDMDDSLRSRIRGEAYFLRALYYFSLEDYYGDVPLITHAPVITDSSMARTPRAQVVSQIILDLDSAAKLLPLSYSGSDVGRATRGAALGLAARVLLYEASPLNNTGNDLSKWQAAATAAQAVMNLNVYSLFNNYRALFLPQNENNSEVIFDVQYTAAGSQYATGWDTYLGIYNGAYINSGWSSLEPTTDFVDEYEMIDGSTWSPGNPIADPNNKYNNRDPRLDMTLFREGKLYNGTLYPVTGGWPGIYTGFSFKKYTINDSNNTTTVPYLQSTINGILIRYADVLMMYAEAQNEAVGPDATVYSAINAVRARAGMPALPGGLSQAAMRQRIWHERRMEFVLEGLYYSDVRRWMAADSVLNRPIQLNGANEQGAIQVRKFDPSKNYLWPIPQSEITADPNLRQNPGY